MAWMTIITCWAAVNSQSSNSHEIHMLNNNTRFMEILGKAVMASDIWTIFANVSIRNHAEADESLQKMVNSIYSLYQMIESHTASPSLIKFNNNSLATIKTLRGTIKFIRYMERKQQGMMHKIRVRRAIEEGGTLLNWLFGTMDADNKREISQQLQSLGAHENATFNLLHRQITVTKSALESLKKPLQKLAHESELLSDSIHVVTEDVRTMNESITNVTMVLQAQTSINGLLELAMQKSWELKNILAEELQVIEAVINKQFHHGLINIDTLQ